jgi:hypothetical protein
MPPVMSFTMIYVLLAIGVPAFTFGGCLLAVKLMKH